MWIECLDTRHITLRWTVDSLGFFKAELKKQYGLEIVGPRADAERIPGIDIPLGDGDSWQFGDLEMCVMDTPGHTRGHITLHFPEAGALFPGAPSDLCFSPLPLTPSLPVEFRHGSLSFWSIVLEVHFNC